MMQQYIRVLPLVCLLSLIAPAASWASNVTTGEKTSAVSVVLPPQIGDGTAFPCTLTGAGLKSATLSFLGKSITAKAIDNSSGQGEITLLLPVPLDHKSGSETLDWKAALAAGTAVREIKGTTSVRIVRRAYPVQKLTVQPKYVTPDPELKERINRERELMGAALNSRSGSRNWNLPMARPVPGKLTSLYGLRRVLNNQPRSPHKGLDFRAAAGTPIAAVADGTIVLTGDFYYAGKFVVVDHGLGVVSISMHMSEILAEKGQVVKRGDHVGLVGSTGRSTGPHLHLGISILGESIDALPLMEQTEEDKAAYAAVVNNASTAQKKKRAAKSAKNPKTGTSDKLPVRKAQ